MGGFFGVVSRKNCKYDVFFGTERCVLYRMDLTLKSTLSIIKNHTTASCSQMGMIINSEKNV